MSIQQFVGNKYVGLSTDVKPLNVIEGSVFYESNTLKIFLLVGGVWEELIGYSGVSGYSGFSGTSGATGESGFSGVQGFSGISGVSGLSGQSGFSGLSGDQANLENVNHIQMNINPSISGFQEGRIYYDFAAKALAVQMGGTSGIEGVNLQIGCESLQRIYNNTGHILLNGKAIRPTGTYGDFATGDYSLATAPYLAVVMGVTTQDIPDGEYGYITYKGSVHGLDTSNFLAGEALYLSDTIPGGLQNTPPVGVSSIVIEVARALLINSTEGSIYVTNIPSVSLNSLTDVVLTNPVIDQTLRYNGVKWINGAAQSASAGAGVNFYPSDLTTIIDAGSGPQSEELEVLGSSPANETEQQDGALVEWMSGMTYDIKFIAQYMFPTALNREIIDAGRWIFNQYAFVSHLADEGTISTIVSTIYKVSEATGTVTFTDISGEPTKRLATVSVGGTHFITGEISTDIEFTNKLITPEQICYIIEFIDDHNAIVQVLENYTNETSVAFSTCHQLFTLESANITNIEPGLMTTSTVQPSFPILVTDKIMMAKYAKTTCHTATTIYFVHSGTAHCSSFTTPLVQNHNELAGIQGGDANEKYHLSHEEYIYQLPPTVVGKSGYVLTNDGVAGYWESATALQGYSGISGTSGFSGTSGLSGTSGISGTSGESGVSGYSGVQGFSGISGTSGFSGVQGFSGISGFSGVQGFSGTSGFSGVQGFSGISGTSGFSGFSGVSGYSGLNGFPISLLSLAHNTTQACGASMTDILFNTQNIAPVSIDISHSTSVNNDRITINTTGYYHISFFLGTDTIDNNTVLSAQVRIDDTSVIAGSESLAHTGNAATGNSIQGSFIAYLTAGQFITLQAMKVAAGENWTANTFFNIHRLGGAKGDSGYSGTSGLSGYSGLNSGLVTLKKTANQTINAGAGVYTDVTGLTFPVVNGADYAFRFYIVIQSANINTGWGMAVNCPNGTLDYHTRPQTVVNNPVGVNNYLDKHSITRDDMTVLAGTIVANEDLYCLIEGRYLCTQNGTFAIRAANELANNNITVRQGSWGTYF